jgi:hypothetical protein
MKTNKWVLRFLVSLMAVCMVLSVGAVSVGEDVHIFDYYEKEIIISGSIDYQTAQSIAASINGELIVISYNMPCILGHSTARTTVIETTHRYYTSAPRCLKRTYDVTYCKRSGCGYSVSTLIGQTAIHCC